MFQHRIQTLALTAVLLSAPHAALALSCKDAQTESIRRVITLNEDLYISMGDVTPGKLLWRSENYTVSFRCVDDFNSPNGEDAYLYWDPARTLAQIHPSIEAGITFKSIDHRPIPGGREQAGSGTSLPATTGNCTMYWNNSSAPQCATSQIVTVTFSAYIKATGAAAPANGQITDTGTYDLFQVDGVGGLNSRPDSNYRAAITGLGRIRFIACNPEISVVANGGNTIKFGTIAAHQPQPGTIARSVPFTVAVNMSGPHAGDQCHGRALVGSFSTSYPVHNTTAIMPSSNSGFGIVLADADDPATEIAMSTAVPLGVVNSMIVNHNFVASLKWLSTAPQSGPFKASATLDVSFR